MEFCLSSSGSFPELGRRHIGEFLEGTVKRSHGVKTNFVSNFREARHHMCWTSDHPLCFFNALKINRLIKIALTFG